MTCVRNRQAFVADTMNAPLFWNPLPQDGSPWGVLLYSCFLASQGPPRVCLSLCQGGSGLHSVRSSTSIWEPWPSPSTCQLPLVTVQRPVDNVQKPTGGAKGSQLTLAPISLSDLGCLPPPRAVRVPILP